jgi:hypothetical protein
MRNRRDHNVVCHDLVPLASNFRFVDGRTVASRLIRLPAFGRSHAQVASEQIGPARFGPHRPTKLARLAAVAESA